MGEKASMDSVPPAADNLCYVRCNFCNTVLAGFGPFGSEIKKGSTSSSSSTSSEPVSPRAPSVVKPPEKKHRLPSAYNRFMKEEIQRIKAANPEIPHREAFSAAAKNWARFIPNSPGGPMSGSCSNHEQE
ncbi:hypothetical protein RHMOL_Rhmol12G0080600 [Rhododendron molle]|uniref:Uncharacterized protein n=1 Tax=Rhododendron molle TaxID=49168 RepID=A0ACC0LFH0_RHOML|nr:hypothetical protein RHMOL_Rhmol12G0080600 [Rhododendron molle]